MGYGINWDSYSHQELYDMIHNNGDFGAMVQQFSDDGTVAVGKGASGGSSVQQTWTDAVQLMSKGQEDLQTALRNAGAVWQGQAADAMQSAMTPMGQWAQDSGETGQTFVSGMGDHLDAFSYAVNTMPEPATVQQAPSNAFVAALTMQQDQQEQDAAAQQAKQRAVEVMQRYSELSESAVDGMGEWTPPATVTINATPAASAPSVVAHQVTAPQVTGSWSPRSLAASAGRPATGNPAAPVTTTISGHPSAPEGITVTTAPQQASGTNDPVSVVVDGNPAAAPGSGDGGGTSGPPIVGGGVPQGGGPESEPGGRIPSRGASGSEPEPASKANAGVAEEVADAERGAAAEAEGARSTTVAPSMGRGGKREEDREHRMPDYLRGPHQEFWDPDHPVAPPVIGE